MVSALTGEKTLSASQLTTRSEKDKGLEGGTRVTNKLSPNTKVIMAVYRSRRQITFRIQGQLVTVFLAGYDTKGDLIGG